MIEIDGSAGEGGGQILRSSLSLAAITQQPLCISNIRAGRNKPGLLRQHLTGLRALAEISSAQVTGAELRSTRVTFLPGDIKGGDYHFAVGTAGSALLVLQTVLPVLLSAEGPSNIVIEGGTHAAFAPPFDFVESVYLPVLRKMGADISLRLLRTGFYPAGGGRIEAAIKPAALTPMSLRERQGEPTVSARIYWAHMRPAIAQRQARLLGVECEVIEAASVGPGSAVVLRVQWDDHAAIFSAFGKRGRSSEQQIKALRAEVDAYLTAAAPVDVYLADQLILPFALAGGGAFRTTGISKHTATNIDVVKRFVDIDISVERIERGNCLVEFSTR